MTKKIYVLPFAAVDLLFNICQLGYVRTTSPSKVCECGPIDDHRMAVW